MRGNLGLAGRREIAQIHRSRREGEREICKSLRIGCSRKLNETQVQSWEKPYPRPALFSFLNDTRTGLPVIKRGISEKGKGEISLSKRLPNAAILLASLLFDRYAAMEWLHKIHTSVDHTTSASSNRRLREPKCNFDFSHYCLP